MISLRIFVSGAITAATADAVVVYGIKASRVVVAVFHLQLALEVQVAHAVLLLISQAPH